MTTETPVETDPPTQGGPTEPVAAIDAVCSHLEAAGALLAQLVASAAANSTSEERRRSASLYRTLADATAHVDDAADRVRYVRHMATAPDFRTGGLRKWGEILNRSPFRHQSPFPLS